MQAVHGRVDADDRLIAPAHAAMEPIEGYDGNRWQYSLVITLDRNGPFGYTVRVLPSHAGLAASEELGLQAVPAPVGRPRGRTLLDLDAELDIAACPVGGGPADPSDLGRPSGSCAGRAPVSPCGPPGDPWPTARGRRGCSAAAS